MTERDKREIAELVVRRLREERETPALGHPDYVPPQTRLSYLRERAAEAARAG
jgi:hypothetical protein